MGDRLATWFANAATRLFGPVFALEASRVGRRMSTFVVRWVYLSILVSVVGVFYYSWQTDLRNYRGVVQPSELTRFAENFFWVYALTQFLAIATLTPAFTAATITDEKERKTLDFLLVTDLSGREILFGKLAVRVAVLITFVLAGLPVVSIMQFVGGIDPRLLLLSAGMTLVTVLSLSAISVVASVLLARTRDAVVLAYAIPVAYLWVVPWGSVPGSQSSVWESVVEVFAAGNPFLAGREMGRSFGAGGVPIAAQWYIGFHLVVAMIGFVFAGFWLRGSAGTTGASNSGPRTRLGRMFAWVIGRRTKARRHPPVSDEPMRWREVYVEPGSGGGVLRRVLVLGVLAAVFIPFLEIVADFLLRNSSSYFYSSDPVRRFQQQTKVWVCACTCGLGILMLLRATVRGASSVAGERDRDTWVSLLGTPLTTREILEGKWAGCVWGQRDLLFLLAAVWGIGAVTGSVNPLALIPAGVLLVVYLMAFAWLGISYSASAKNSRSAIGKALPLALLLGGGHWFIIGCCCFGASLGRAADSDVFVFLSGTMMGATPPFVLAALPALDSELLSDSLRHGGTLFAGMVVGAILGGVGWGLLAYVWSDKSRTAFAKEANRNENETPVSRRPRGAGMSAGPPDDWDT